MKSSSTNRVLLEETGLRVEDPAVGRPLDALILLALLLSAAAWLWIAMAGSEPLRDSWIRDLAVLGQV